MGLSSGPINREGQRLNEESIQELEDTQAALTDLKRLDVATAIQQPLAYELQVLAKLVAKDVKKLPPPIEVAVALVIVGVVAAVGVSVEALLAALPREMPNDVTPEVEQNAIKLIEQLRSVGANPTDIQHAIKFIEQHAKNLSPATGPAPVFGDELIPSALVADETIRLIVQFIRDLG